MKKTGCTIPYICLATGFLLAAAALIAGCANAGGSGESRTHEEQAATDNGQVPACKAAIEDVSRYCSGDNASTGKCNDAKAKTRQHCID